MFIFLNNDIEAFTNIIYNKYPETLVEEKDGLDISKLYDNYQGELKDQMKWENKNLAQCQTECNNLENCIGFSRDNIDDDMLGNCYPRTNLSICHSIRKGNPQQRETSSDFVTFLKSDVPNQKNKCLGSNSLTLNRLIYINSYAKPTYFISNDKNSIKLKSYQFNGSQFINNCKFKIVEGLSGEGTISIQITDNYNENYYLSNNGRNGITIVPLKVGADNKSTLKARNNASFELLDGFANPHYVSFKTHSLTNNHKYLIVHNKNSNDPRLKLVSLDEAKKNASLATFDILDNITRTSIITSNSEFKSTTPSSNNNKSSKNNFKSVKTEKFQTVLDIKPKVELQLSDNTIIPILYSENDLEDVIFKYRIKLHNLEPLSMSQPEKDDLIKASIVKIHINVPDTLVGLYSEKNYKSHSEEENIADYENKLEVKNNNDKKKLYKKFREGQKPNIAMLYGDIFDYDINRPSGIALSESTESTRSFANGTVLQNEERKLLKFGRSNNQGHILIKPNMETNNLNIKSIKIVNNIVSKLQANAPVKNIYSELKNIQETIENDTSSTNNIDEHISNLKQKYNKYKEQTSKLTNELLERQTNLNDKMTRANLNKSKLEIKDLASDFFFVKNLSNETLNTNNIV